MFLRFYVSTFLRFYVSMYLCFYVSTFLLHGRYLFVYFVIYFCLFLSLFMVVLFPKLSLLNGVLAAYRLVKVTRPGGLGKRCKMLILRWFYRHQHFWTPLLQQRQGPSLHRTAATATLFSPMSIKPMLYWYFWCSKSPFVYKTNVKSILLYEIHAPGKDTPRIPPGDPQETPETPRDPQLGSKLNQI